MQLIKKIEVRYLRSLYSLTLDRVGDLNVVFGRNDSGKSNFLRALNLFFNGISDSDQEFDFSIDMSDHRKKEARDAKGKQFVWIKVTFNVPSNYTKALGREITIKKQWNRDGGVTTTTMGGDKNVQSARLTRFINDIDYTYIPAIKDISVFADLIERMYGAAAVTPDLSEAAKGFVDAIAGQASSLTTKLSAMFNSKTHLALPTQMEKLFRNLDFSLGDDNHSLLKQKGDGIKARHIPELLKFINENEPRTKFYLWGIEEPENSLDLGAAEIEAQRFAQFATGSDTQIFVTSHSPAFYLANPKGTSNIKRYFITKQSKKDSDIKSKMQPENAASPIDSLETAEKKMEHAGLLQLPFVIKKLEVQNEIIQKHSEDASQLRAEIQSHQSPTLYVEGHHDIVLFTDAINRLAPETDISVKALGGTPDTTNSLFKAIQKQGGFSPNSKTTFLFDNDFAGRKAYENMYRGLPQHEPIQIGEMISVWALPENEEHKKFLRKYNIRPANSILTAEFLFSADECAKICLDLVEEKPSDDKLKKWKDGIHQSYWDSLPQEVVLKLINAGPGTPDWFFARGVPKQIKCEFAERVKQIGVSTERVDEITKKVIEFLC